MTGQLDKNSPVTIIEQYKKNGTKRDLERFLESVPEDLHAYLKRSRGLMVYQEQIMQIAQKMAGYSLGGADLLRRAIGLKISPLLKAVQYEFVYGTEKGREMIGSADEYIGKNKHLITKEKHLKALEGYLKELHAKTPDKFVPGAIQNGYNEEYALNTFKQIEAFSGYGFNASHAVAYTDISFQTAWLKCYYPAEFICAYLTTDKAKLDKVKMHLAEAKQMGVRVLPPDINQSIDDYTIAVQEDGEKLIRYGLQMKDVGENAVANILKERNANGPFQSVKEFVERMKGTRITKATVESLIKVGAFESLEGDRHESLMNYMFNIYYPTQTKKKREEMDAGPKPVSPTPKKSIMMYEEEIIGMCLSFNVLDGLPYKAWELIENGESAELGVVIRGLREHQAKNGTMAFVTAEMLAGTFEMPVFAEKYKQYENHLKIGNVLVVRGKKKIETSGKYEGKESFMLNSLLYAENWKPKEKEPESPPLDLTPKQDYVADLITEDIPLEEESPPPVPVGTKMTLIVPTFNPMWDF